MTFAWLTNMRHESKSNQKPSKVKSKRQETPNWKIEVYDSSTEREMDETNYQVAISERSPTDENEMGNPSDLRPPT